MFLIFGTLRLFMMTTNLFVIANVKQLRTDDRFRILLPFFRTTWRIGVLNSSIFNSFHNRVEFGTILEGLRNFFLGGGGFEHPKSPPGTPLMDGAIKVILNETHISRGKRFIVSLFESKATLCPLELPVLLTKLSHLASLFY